MRAFYDGLDELLHSIQLIRLPGPEYAFLIVAAVAIGIATAYAAIVFHYLIGLSHGFFLGDVNPELGILTAPAWQRVLAPAVGGVLVGILAMRFAPEVQGSGIPQVMESLAVKGGVVRFRVAPLKILATSLTIGSGGSAGREGPIVHIGASVGSLLGQLFKLPARKLRTFVGCGVAAGIAATFNAPIAGALFALEVVLFDIRVASMAPIVVSAVIATIVSRYHLGDFPAFPVPPYELRSAGELSLYALLGVLAALVAVVFIHSVFATMDLLRRLPIPGWVLPGFGGLMVGLVGLLFPLVVGLDYEVISGALWGKLGAGALLILLLTKTLTTSLTLGSGGSGGVFAPSLLLGAALGGAFGAVVHEWFPTWTAPAPAYALVGMGAVFAATSHAPITAILIVFELTNDYRSVPPLMLACVLAVLISGHLKKESMEGESLRRKGIDLRRDREINLLKTIDVASVMEESLTLVEASAPCAELISTLLSDTRGTAAIVDKSGALVGSVELHDLREILKEQGEFGPLVVAADVADTTTPFILSSDNLDLAMHLFGRSARSGLVVCDSTGSRRPVGLLTRQCVIDAYNRRIFQEDLSGGFGTLVNAVESGRTVEVLGGVHLGEVDVPGECLGKPLRLTELRSRLGLEVLVVRRSAAVRCGVEGRSGIFPNPDLVLEPGGEEREYWWYSLDEQRRWTRCIGCPNWEVIFA
ncbi:MAG: chloride channel protein [Myxococcota bacterium]|nr:chloride channel protein [Myxococcota bacterium]